MRAMLVANRLWEAVKGDETNTTKLAKAMNAIAKNVSEQELTVSMKTSTAKAAWTVLQWEYAGSLSQDIATLTMELNGV